jgi:hypothetical protein
MRQALADRAWQIALAGVIVLGAGFAAIFAASVQGMALVPGGSLSDGYDVGLLPWMGVGTWLVPLGAFVAFVASTIEIWVGARGFVPRLITVPLILVVAFWVLLAAIGMAPRNGPSPNGSTTSSSLETVVYSSPANTLAFLVLPMAAAVLVAARTRPRRLPPRG